MGTKKRRPPPPAFTRREVVGLLLSGLHSGDLPADLLERIYAWSRITTEECDEQRRGEHWRRRRDGVGLLVSFQALVGALDPVIAAHSAPDQTWWALREIRAWVMADRDALLEALCEAGRWPPRQRCGHGMIYFSDGGCDACRRGIAGAM